MNQQLYSMMVPSFSSMNINELVRESFRLAQEANDLGDGAYGAIIVDEQNEIITRAGNTTNSDHSSTYHTEINAIQQAEYNLGVGNLAGCTLISSAEPCPMCSSATVWSGLDAVIFGISLGRLIEEGESQIRIPCRSIFRLANQVIALSGPDLEEEGVQLLNGRH